MSDAPLLVGPNVVAAVVVVVVAVAVVVVVFVAVVVAVVVVVVAAVVLKPSIVDLSQRFQFFSDLIPASLSSSFLCVAPPIDSRSSRRG